jgi:hypothetical protein
MSGYYIMVDGEICSTELAPGLVISTVFLGLDHNFGGQGAPVLFETMVFGGDWSEQECERYTSIADARKGHARMVATVVERLSASAA